MDLDREKDVRQLRRIAKMQQVQIDKLLRVLASQSKRIDELVGSPGELQQALDLLEKLAPKADAKAADEAPEKPKKKRKKRTKFGSTAQPLLPVVEQVFELDAPDHAATARFINALELFRIGVSWGGIESLALSASRSDNQPPAEGIPARTVRLSIGLEGAAALIADLEQALSA